MREWPIFKQTHMGSSQKPGFLLYPIPEIPDDFEKKSGRVRVSTKTSGSGRVSGTRWALILTLKAHWNFVKRISRYFCISSQALHSTAPSGSLSSKSEWLTMHDIAWCTMVLVLPCFIYVMPSIRIARNCMSTPNCCIHVHVLSKQQFTNALLLLI